MKKIILISIIAILTLAIGVSFYMKNIYVPKEILRTAIKESELSGGKYILCKAAVTTGFQWVLIKDEDGNRTHEVCNIIGEDPLREFNLRHEFKMADNTFVFYIQDKQKYYSERMKVEVLEYVVVGWDILSPVKHSDLYRFDIFGTSKYITKNDVDKSVLR